MERDNLGPENLNRDVEGSQAGTPGVQPLNMRIEPEHSTKEAPRKGENGKGGRGQGGQQSVFERRAWWLIILIQGVVVVGLDVLLFELRVLWGLLVAASLSYILSAAALDYLILRQIEAPSGIRQGNLLKWFLLGGLVTLFPVPMLILMIFRAKMEAHVESGRENILWCVMIVGVALLFIVPALFAYGLALRIDLDSVGGRWKLLARFAPPLVIMLMGVFGMRAAIASVDENRTPWVAFSAAAVLLPIMAGWVAATIVWYGSVSLLPPDYSGSFGAKAEAKVTNRGAPGDNQVRGACLEQQDKWVVRGEPMRVAVSLSGGGYRAAITHAGILAAMEEHCVPIHHLSTVSGGSIIGAYYAGGLSPRDFYDQLHKGKPGLSNDLIVIPNAFRDWFHPFSTNAETYSSHFARAFFGKTKLSGLRGMPVLLVNATDLEVEGDESREVFYKGRTLYLDNNTHVSEVVAASAAFPGVFQPKRLWWVNSRNGSPCNTKTDCKERKFIDGGVVENLGVEGLRRYLKLTNAGIEKPVLPHILIISDGSRYGRQADFPTKLGIVKLVNKAQEISFDALHRQLYARYTGHYDYVEWAKGKSVQDIINPVDYKQIDVQFAGVPDKLFTVVIPITAAQTEEFLKTNYPLCKFSDPSQRLVLNLKEQKSLNVLSGLQKYVSEFKTLNELEPYEVEAGFWLGYQIGLIYRPAIECARLRVINPGDDCTGLDWPSYPGSFTCPSLTEVLTRAAVPRQ